MTALDELRADLVEEHTELLRRYIHAKPALVAGVAGTMDRLGSKIAALDDLTRRHARTVAALQAMAAEKYDLAMAYRHAFQGGTSSMYHYAAIFQHDAAALSRLVRTSLGIEGPE